MGKPRKIGGLLRDRKFQLSVSREELQRCHRLAERMGFPSVSEMLRYLVLRETEVLDERDAGNAKILAEVRR